MNIKEFDDALWTYRGRYIRTIDGDTILALVELPFNIRVEMHIRLAGFSAPERYTPEGKVASERVRSLFASDRYSGAMLEQKFWPLRIRTLRRDDGGETKSFERFVAETWLCSEDGTMTNLVDLLAV